MIRDDAFAARGEEFEGLGIGPLHRAEQDLELPEGAMDDISPADAESALVDAKGLVAAVRAKLGLEA